MSIICQATTRGDSSYRPKSKISVLVRQVSMAAHFFCLPGNEHRVRNVFQFRVYFLEKPRQSGRVPLPTPRGLENRIPPPRG